MNAQQLIANEYLIDQFCDSIPQDFRYSVRSRFVKLADAFRKLYGKNEPKRMDLLLDFQIYYKSVKSAITDYKRLRAKRAQNEKALQRHCEKISIRVYDYIVEHSYAFSVNENSTDAEQFQAVQGMGLVYGKIRTLINEDGFISIEPLDWSKLLGDFAEGEKEYSRDILSFIIKFTDHANIFRRYRREIRRQKEELARRLGFVSQYCSENALREQSSADKRNQLYLAGMEIERDDGERFSLEEVVKHSLANPSNRLAQMMARVAGLEKLGNYLGYVPTFYTVTAPSRFHKKSSYYDGSSPSQARKHLQDKWEDIRAVLSKSNIDYFGLRVAEAHKDGTPHWHLMIWVQPGQSPAIVDNVFKRYSMQEDNKELVNKDGFIRFEPSIKDKNKGVVFKVPRLEIKRMLSHLGHPTGYIIKYISKNLQNFDGNKAPSNVMTSADRVTTWARTHRVKQFQFFGDAKQGVWGEMRRLSDDDIKRRGLELSGKAEQLRQYCRNNDWFNYVLMMDEHEIVVEKEIVRTEETYSKKALIKGVRFVGHDETYQTRFHEWKKVEPEQAQEQAEPQANAQAWSPYTKCNFIIRDEIPLIRAKSEVDARIYEFKDEIKGLVANGFEFNAVLATITKQKIPIMLDQIYKQWAIVPELLDSIVDKLRGSEFREDEYLLREMAMEYLFDEYGIDFFSE